MKTKPKRINLIFNIDNVNNQYFYILSTSLFFFLVIIFSSLIKGISLDKSLFTFLVFILICSIYVFIQKRLKTLIISYNPDSIIILTHLLCTRKLVRIRDISNFKISYGKKWYGRSTSWILEFYINNKKYCRIVGDIDGWKKTTLAEIVKALEGIGVERKGDREYYFD